MVLAIECDGACYHSSATARDRDRLRQDHLERLGWQFHPIWSTEWFRRREDEVARALEAYKAAVVAVDSELNSGPWDAHVRSAVEQIVAAPLAVPPERQGPMPIRPNGGPITAYSHAELVCLVRWIESDTLLRTEEEVVDEAVGLLGYRRHGADIVACTGRGCRLPPKALNCEIARRFVAPTYRHVACWRAVAGKVTKPVTVSLPELRHHGTALAYVIAHACDLVPHDHPVTTPPRTPASKLPASTHHVCTTTNDWSTGTKQRRLTRGP